MNFSSILTKFLQETGALEFEKAGPGHPGTVTAEQKEAFVKNLISQSRHNTVLVYMMAIMLLVLFAVSIYFALYYKDDPKNIKLVLGGSLLGLLVIVRLLFSIWKEKSKMDLLVTIVLNSTPAQAKEIVENIYYKSILKKK